MKEIYSTNLLERYLDTFGMKLEKEFRFCSKRRFRSDFCIKVWRILIEVEGGVWSNGRHTRGSGFTKDMEKYNLATIMGYQLLRITPADFRKTQAICLLEQWRLERLARDK